MATVLCGGPSGYYNVLSVFKTPKLNYILSTVVNHRIAVSCVWGSGNNAIRLSCSYLLPPVLATLFTSAPTLFLNSFLRMHFSPFLPPGSLEFRATVFVMPLGTSVLTKCIATYNLFDRLKWTECSAKLKNKSFRHVRTQYGQEHAPLCTQVAKLDFSGNHFHQRGLLPQWK